MSLAIGDKVRLKRTYRVVYHPTTTLSITTSTTLFEQPIPEFVVDDISDVTDTVLISRGKGLNYIGIRVTRDSVEKVEDQPLNERVVLTPRVKGVNKLDGDKVSISFDDGVWVDGFFADSETAKTIRLGDEYEVIIRRKA